MVKQLKVHLNLIIFHKQIILFNIAKLLQTFVSNVFWIVNYLWLPYINLSSIINDIINNCN